MNKTPDNAKFLELLMGLQQNLLNLASSAAESAKPVELDQTRVGRLSRMDALQSQAMSIETEHRRKQHLQQIGAAIKRIETGDYGFCVNCEEPIAEQRLLVDPCAQYCIDCAAAKEQV